VSQLRETQRVVSINLEIRIMYRFIAALALPIASVTVASAQMRVSVWQNQRGAVLKVLSTDRATGTFSGVFINGPGGACPGVNYDLTGRVQLPQRYVVFGTSRTWTSDCAVTTVWSGRPIGAGRAVVRWTATWRAPNGRLVRTYGTDVFSRI
jgi:hypothetical protein